MNTREPGWWVRLAYAIGTAGFTSLIAATSFYYSFFLTDVVLLPPILAANALLVGKLWDSVNDPFVGVAMDRVRARFPLRRWLIASAGPLAFASVAIWWFPPGMSQTGHLLWAVGTYLLFDTFFTIAQLGFNALGAEATTRYDARTRLMAFGAVGAVVGYVVGSAGFRFASRFVTEPATAYVVAGGVMALLAGGGALFAGLRLNETPPLSGQPLPTFKRVGWVLRQSPFLLLIGAMALTRIALTVVSAVVPYFAKYYLGNEGLAPTLILTLLAVVSVLIPLWKRLAERWGKAKAYAASLALASGGMASTWWFNPSDHPAMLYGSVALLGVGMAGHWVLPWAILPDVVDWDEAQTGERRLGLYYALYGLADKLSRTVGIASIGWVLGSTGFVANISQGESSLLAIRALFGPVPALLILCALPFLIRFPIDRATHQKIREKIDGQPDLETPVPLEDNTRQLR